MPQHVDTETYKKFVDTLGIEEAYKQRFRGTGRTVRDILRLTQYLSEGKDIVMFSTAESARTRYQHIHVLERVAETAYSLGMDVQFSRVGGYIIYKPSGGTIKVFSGSPRSLLGMRFPKGTEVYTLHGN